MREIQKRWRMNNPVKKLADTRKRQAAKINAIPKWYEQEEVEKLYEQSRLLTKMTGILHHVDHIIPLQNAKVCGLHCMSNLQILTAQENQTKGNVL